MSTIFRPTIYEFGHILSRTRLLISFNLTSGFTSWNRIASHRCSLCSSSISIMNSRPNFVVLRASMVFQSTPVLLPTKSPPWRKSNGHLASHAKNEPPGTCSTRLSRGQDHAVRRLRTQRHLRAHYRRPIRNGCKARERRETERDRLLIQKPRVLPESCSQL